MLLGLPEELKTETVSMQTDLGDSLVTNVTAVLLHVTRTDKPHRKLPESAFPWFIGQVKTEPLGVKSIKGMSGGPIFGLKKRDDGQYLYWAVALQSWWDPETRTTYGCPLPIFGRILIDYLNAHEGNA